MFGVPGIVDQAGWLTGFALASISNPYFHMTVSFEPLNIIYKYSLFRFMCDIPTLLHYFRTCAF